MSSPSAATKLAVIRSANRAWIETLKVPIIESGAMLTVIVMNRKIDFWPASNSYYLHSKQRYGMGIAELVKKIREIISASF